MFVRKKSMGKEERGGVAEKKSMANGRGGEQDWNDPRFCIAILVFFVAFLEFVLFGQLVSPSSFSGKRLTHTLKMLGWFLVSFVGVHLFRRWRELQTTTTKKCDYTLAPAAVTVLAQTCLYFLTRLNSEGYQDVRLHGSVPLVIVGTMSIILSLLSFPRCHIEDIYTLSLIFIFPVLIVLFLIYVFAE